MSRLGRKGTFGHTKRKLCVCVCVCVRARTHTHTHTCIMDSLNVISGLLLFQRDIYNKEHHIKMYKIMHVQEKSELAHLCRYLSIFTCKIGNLLTFSLLMNTICIFTMKSTCAYRGPRWEGVHIWSLEIGMVGSGSRLDRLYFINGFSRNLCRFSNFDQLVSDVFNHLSDLCFCRNSQLNGQLQNKNRKMF